MNDEFDYNSFLRNLPELNLPKYNFDIEVKSNFLKIYDEVRKKFVKLTPEEWIRQNFVKFMINDLKYPKSMIIVESIVGKNAKKRSDIILYNKQLRPFMLVECKNEKIKIDQLGLNQISKYNFEIKANYLVITNGQQHIIFEMDYLNNSIEVKEDFPAYQS